MTARLVATVVVLACALLLASVGGAVAARRGRDQFAGFHYRRLTRYAAVLAALVGLAIVWRNAVGHLALVGGLLVAGLAFAMQEVIGALAGWFNIVSGAIYRVGDRVELGGVKGDVIDITPLRTKVLEMGSGRTDEPSWVGGRQYTGRIVSISNKTTFEEPVYNYSSFFEYIWEELKVGVPYRSDWHEAERIVLDEVQRVSASEGARGAIDAMSARYPVPKHELEPRVYVTLTDSWVELAARFVVPVREARGIKDQVSRALLDRFREAGLEMAFETMEVNVVSSSPEPA